jgi:flagellar hook-associated protein 3 FlgL
VLTGRDVHPLETNSVFNTLLRLANALDSSDQAEIVRTVMLLDGNLNQLNFSRAELGSRQQSLDVIQQRLEVEEIELRTSLSEEIDVDFVKAISDITARQAALEASMRLIGQTFQISLLNFL